MTLVGIHVVIMSLDMTLVVTCGNYLILILSTR